MRQRNTGSAIQATPFFLMSSRNKTKGTSQLGAPGNSGAAVGTAVQRRLALLAFVDEQAVMGFVGEVLEADMSAAAVMAACAGSGARLWVRVPVLSEGRPDLPFFKVVFVLTP